MYSGDLAQFEYEAAVHELSLNDFELHGRQLDAPLEMAVRNLEPPYVGTARAERHLAARTHDDAAGIEQHFDAFRRNARKRDHDEIAFFILENVDRRLPHGPGAARRAQPEELAMEALGLLEHLAGFRPHPRIGVASRHRFLS